LISEEVRHSAAYFKAETDPFYPRFWPERLEQLKVNQKPRGIFVCDMSDLFGIGIPEQWTRVVLDYMKNNPWHRFYLLTKQPQNLIKWSPFPENCFVGVTATNELMFQEAAEFLLSVKASIKYISFEPLLEWAVKDYLYSTEELLKAAGISWIIIGAMTCSGGDLAKSSSQFPELTPKPFGNRYVLLPKIEWVKKIVNAADKAGVAVFLKDNLRSLVGDNLRQELP